jgi:hypothetical protein
VWRVSTREHLEALRAADDRRYAEVALEREKALRIKDTADRDALALARQGQTYRDEQANKLREQINSERGLYATKDDLANAVREMTAAIKPLAEYVSGAAGRSGGEADSKTERRLDVGQIIAVIAVIALIISVLIPHLK